MSDGFLSFTKGLLLGWVQPERILPFPEPDEDERETAQMLLDSYRAFAKDHLDGARFDEEHAVPEEVRRGLAELGVLGLTVPEEHGGSELGYSTYCRIMEETNRYCGSVAVILGGHQSIGIKALLLHGSEEQKARWLPKLASGEWFAAYALSEPQAGSDPASLQTTADPTPDGQGYVLNGQKIWCTNGGFAEFITVFAKTPTPDGGRAITCFAVTAEEMAQSGFTRGAEEDKLGLRGSSTTTLFFDGLEVPAGNIIGTPGKGLRVALEVLNYGRASLAAGCAGASKRILEEAARHAGDRVQFGRPIAEFEMVQAKLAEMAADTYATETIAYLTVALADRGDPDFSIEAAICKVFGTEAHWRTCNHAVQIAGGIAYVREYPYERFLRDARINMIFEGTNEILCHFIALAGTKHAAQAIAAGATDAAGLRKHARQLAGVSDGPTSFGPVPDELTGESAALDVLSEKLGLAVHATLASSGEDFAEREFEQERVARTIVDLYVGYACIARAAAALERGGATDELAVARKAIRDATARVAAQLAGLERNDDDLTTEVSRVAVRTPAWSFELRP